MARVRWSEKDIEKGLKRLRDSQDFEQKKRKAAPKKSKPKTTVPDAFCLLILKETGYTLLPEKQFHPKRKWRFDYCIPELKIAIEKEGGVWTNGRHTRGKGYIKDMEKYNNAILLGWHLLRFTPDQMLTNTTLQQIKLAIQKRVSE